MAINITDANLIERQHKMMGLGMMVQQIASMMSRSDAEIIHLLADGRTALANANGDKAARIAKVVRAFEIELEIRKTA
jgi:hypothetical protein